MTTSDDFRDAIRAHGLTPPDVLEPGRFHRFPGAGKSNGNTAGFCKLFADERGGIFGDFATGLAENWQAKCERPASAAEREAFCLHAEQAQAEAQAERERAEVEAAQRPPTWPELPGERSLRLLGNLWGPPKHPLARRRR